MIDQATLDQYIADVAGDDQDLLRALHERLGQNPEAATKFVNGFLGRADVTRKQQEVATQRQQLERMQADYEQRLMDADAEKERILKDLASERITAGKAQALLKTVQEAYGLGKNDLPGLDDLRQTERTGQIVDSSPDLDQRLAKFEEKFWKRINDQLLPEISALAIIPPIWSEIEHEHQRLYGKRLTKKEQAEILADARKTNKSLEDVWTDKYGVTDKRLEFRDNENKTKWRQEWDDERAKRDQEMALKGIRPESQEYTFEDQQSPLFRRSFAPKPESEEHAPTTAGASPKTLAGAASDAGRERSSAADRAAAKFMERARTGQLGKPLEPARKTA